MTWNIVTFDSAGKIRDARNAPDSRNIRGYLTWETGAVQAIENTDGDGLFQDGFYIQTMNEYYAPRTITAIDADSATPEATYSGTLLVAGAGLLFGDSGGYPEMRGKLFRVGPDPTSTKFDVYQDGEDDGYNQNKNLADVQSDTTGYGSWGGNVSAQEFINLNSDSGNPGNLPTDADIRVVESIVPPENDVDTADEVFPLIGDYFLSSDIWYWKPNDVITGNTYNSPRFSVRISASAFSYDEEEWVSFAIFLPSNYDHETTHDGDLSKNAVFRVIDDDDSNQNPLTIQLSGWDTGSYDHWMMDWTNGAVEPGGLVQDEDLGSIEDDVGKWTVFTIKLHCHATDGTLKIWKSTGEYTTGKERDDELIWTNPEGGVGPGVTETFLWCFRQYKHGWHHSDSTIDSEVFWVGWDELRYGGVNEGTNFSDVHPFRHPVPLLMDGPCKEGDFRDWRSQGDPNLVYFSGVPDVGMPIQYGSESGQPGWQAETGDGSLMEIVRDGASAPYNDGPVRTGTYAMKTTVFNTADGGAGSDYYDNGNNTRRRTEIWGHLMQANILDLQPYLSERWQSVSIYVPSDWDLDSYAWGPTVHQTKSPATNDISPCLAIVINGSSWEIWHRTSEEDDPNTSEEIPWWMQVQYNGSTEPDEESLVAHFPNETASRAALANLNRGGWTDFVFHMLWDGKGSDQSGTGFLHLWMRSGSGSWVHVLHITPGEVTRGGETFNHGIGYRVPGDGFGTNCGIYCGLDEALDADVSRTLIHDNFKIGDEDAVFALMSPDGSSP